MGSPSVETKLAAFGETQRRDAWWVEILPVVILLGGFGVYATLRAFEGKFYEWGPYLSPFYSPLIDPGHRWWKFSPALLILAGPLGFRATCYYYRKAYYRAFFLDPPACAVSESGKRSYQGETSFPFILQNIHRYFLYLAILFSRAKRRFLLFCKTFIAIFCTWRFCFCCSCGMTRTKDFSFPDDWDCRNSELESVL